MRKKIFIFCFVLFLLSTNSFAQFSSLVNPGPLSSPHSSLEGIKNCSQCHASTKGVPDSKCLTCHTEIQDRINQNKGFHARVVGDCVKCHGEHKGPDYDVTGLSRLVFDHTDTGWPLTGNHQKLSCPNCHTKKRKNITTGELTQFKTYLGNNPNCKSCHKDIHNSQKPTFQQCYKCHDTSSWKQRAQSNFKHNVETDFKSVTGAHTKIECVQCHKQKTWAPLSMACASCHTDPHNNRFGKTCENCHLTQSWNSTQEKPKTSGETTLSKGRLAQPIGGAVDFGATFDHNKTQFALEGQHKLVSCKTCHGPVIGKMQNFQDCAGCHKNPHGDQFQTRYTAKPCSSCHVTEGFKKLNFNHNQDSRFEILGKHTQVKCNQCHADGKFRWMDSTPDCVVCHVDIHKGKFAPKPCASCHTYDGFKRQQIDHNKTSFPLVGKHQAVPCASCHPGNTFKGINHACSTCHNDFHKGELGKECERCHSPVLSFNDVEFNHNREAKFRIDGKHLKNQCNQCHWNNKYKLGDFSCSTCHADVHKGKYGEKCDRCHTTSGFVMAKDFHNFGSFSITGVHNKLECSTCHNPKKPARARPMECSSCHKDPHMNSLGSTCYACHKQTAWMPTTFRHNQTGFELSGAHRFLSCDRCHFNRVFGGLSSECISCHSKDFNSSLPQHAGGITTCNSCHYTFGFRPAKK